MRQKIQFYLKKIHFSTSYTEPCVNESDDGDYDAKPIKHLTLVKYNENTVFTFIPRFGLYS